MKSFVAYPLEFEKMLFPKATNGSSNGKIVAHYELYKKVKHLDGSVVKCGITADEGFNRFAMFKSLMSPKVDQKMIAFEKFSKGRYLENATIDNHLEHTANSSTITLNSIQNYLIEKGVKEEVDFVPGNVNDSLPNYLIEHPELKIAYLNIDLDDYESTLSALEYLYPRLVEGGILVLDNYFKNEEEYKAVKVYFQSQNVHMNNFSVSMGPNYVVKS